MKKLTLVAGLAAALAARAATEVQAASSTFVNTATPGDNLLGYHVYGTETNNRGFSLDFDTTSAPGWSLGVERTYGDLYLFNYNYYNGTTLTAVNTTPFRLRGDTGQLQLGQNTGHPSGTLQVNLTAGTVTAPLNGLGIGVWGGSYGLHLYQNQTTPATKRTTISFNSVYLMGTDSPQNNTADWWLFNAGTGHFVATANADDSLSVNFGLKQAGPLGFYGHAPVATRPVITGCRSDGTALANLLQQLQGMGLITDQTTP